MLLWHATDKKNFDSIMSTGLLAFDFGVFFIDNPTSAAVFVAVRGIKNIVAFPVEFEEDEVIESCDHSPDYFKCRSFYSPKDIPNHRIIIDKILEWKLDT